MPVLRVKPYVCFAYGRMPHWVRTGLLPANPTWFQVNSIAAHIWQVSVTFCFLRVLYFFISPPIIFKIPYGSKGKFFSFQNLPASEKEVWHFRANELMQRPMFQAYKAHYAVIQ